MVTGLAFERSNQSHAPSEKLRVTVIDLPYHQSSNLPFHRPEKNHRSEMKVKERPCLVHPTTMKKNIDILYLLHDVNEQRFPP